MLSAIALGISFFAIQSCKERPNEYLQDEALTNAEITRLKLRIQKLENKFRVQKLENKIDKNNKNFESKDIKTPSGPIKSITFRVGTKDDRLRIYWADGSNSDLPCTKEQSIWVCG